MKVPMNIRRQLKVLMMTKKFKVLMMIENKVKVKMLITNKKTSESAKDVWEESESKTLLLGYSIKKVKKKTGESANDDCEESESNTGDDKPCRPLPQVLNEEKSVKDIHALKSPTSLLYEIFKMIVLCNLQNYLYMKSSRVLSS